MQEWQVLDWISWFNDIIVTLILLLYMYIIKLVQDKVTFLNSGIILSLKYMYLVTLVTVVP